MREGRRPTAARLRSGTLKFWNSHLSRFCNSFLSAPLWNSLLSFRPALELALPRQPISGPEQADRRERQREKGPWLAMEFSQEHSGSHAAAGGDALEEDQIFSCRIENSKIMTDILTAIHAGGKDHICEVKASARALVFSVIGRGKSTQARATLQAEIFEEYIFESSGSGDRANHSTTFSTGGSSVDVVMHFSINLTTLLDCLLLFGSTSESTAATLTYSVGLLVVTP